MDRITLGNSGVEAPVLSLGCLAFGGLMGDTTETDSLATIHAALEHGMNFLDSAASYGPEQEKLIARAIHGRREDVLLATKLFPGKQGAADIRGDLEASLRRLKTDYVDVYYIHVPNTHDLDSNVRMLEVVEKLRAEQKVRAVGVSNFDVAQIEAGLRVSRIDVAQPPYNLLWRYVEKDVLPFCRANGIAVCAYSALGQGILTGKFSRDAAFNNNDARRSCVLFAPEHVDASIEVAQVVRQIAKTHGKTPAQVAINWTLRDGGADVASVGAKNPGQVLDNLGSVGWRLTTEEIASLNAASDKAHRLRPEGPQGLWLWSGAPDPYAD